MEQTFVINCKTGSSPELIRDMALHLKKDGNVACVYTDGYFSENEFRKLLLSGCCVLPCGSDEIKENIVKRLTAYEGTIEV